MCVQYEVYSLCDFPNHRHGNAVACLASYLSMGDGYPEFVGKPLKTQ